MDRIVCSSFTESSFLIFKILAKIKSIVSDPSINNDTMRIYSRTDHEKKILGDTNAFDKIFNEGFKKAITKSI